MANEMEGLDRSRLAATQRSCRALRHDLATPLSAALLHLELARRAVERAPEAVPEHLRVALHTGRVQVDYAARLLDILGELGQESDEPVTAVDLFETASKGLASIAGDLAARSLVVRLETPKKSVTFAGYREGSERAVRELLLGLASLAAPGDFHVDAGAGANAGARLSIRISPKPSVLLDSLFSLSRRGDDDSSPAATGLFLARWFLEGEGGRFETRVEPGRFLVTVILPRGEA
jgi:signal transduction histidine kinase